MINSGYLQDLFVFDITTLDWMDLSANIANSPPPPKFTFGLAVSDDKLFFHGGYSENGAISEFFSSYLLVI